jgi:glycosyltransferase involved in cell wall biosynthesis
MAKKLIIHTASRMRPTFGGGEKFTSDLLDGLSEYENIFIGDHAPLQKIFSDKKLLTLSMGSGYEPIGIKKTILFPVSVIKSVLNFLANYKLYAKAEYIISDVSSLSDLCFLFPLLILIKKKVVFINHWGSVSKELNSSVFKFWARFIYSRCLVFYVSNAQLGAWFDAKFYSKNTFVLPMGVKNQEPELKVKRPDDKVINFGYLARLDYLKGWDVLLNAIPYIKNTNQISLNFKFGGTGQEMEALQKLQSSLTIPKNVTIEWLGFISEVKSFYSLLDCFIFPSRTESLGLVLLEAWSYGVPTIISSLNSFKEILSKNKPESTINSCLVFTTNDYRDLALKIDKFLESIPDLNTKKELIQFQRDYYNIENTFEYFKQKLSHY